MTPYYLEYSDFLATLFTGKVQKLSIDLGFSCPNRDGSIGRGGCIYCNNSAFSPDDAKRGLPVEEQIDRGKAFFAGKYPNMRYLAYFQSYTSTYAAESYLLSSYRAALEHKDTVGIVIGTRPDCIPDRLLQMLCELKEESGKQIIIELGVETSHNTTLQTINRGHTWECATNAIERCHAAGFPVGVHLIMGLPGENEEMMMETVRRVSALPIATIKFHQLQILKNTVLEQKFLAGELPDLHLFEPDEYAGLCARILTVLRADIAVDRFIAQAPAQLLIAPRWGLKNYQFTHLLMKACELQH